MMEYRHNFPLDPREVIRVFEASGIARPTSGLARIARMFVGADLVISAWDAGRLIGVSRSLTEYSYCCYLSDLAIDAAYQRRGVGKRLIDMAAAGKADVVGDQRPGSQLLKRRTGNVAQRMVVGYHDHMLPFVAGKRNQILEGA